MSDKPIGFDEFYQDDTLRVEVLSLTPNPHQVVWLAGREDYSEDPVHDLLYTTGWLNERDAAQWAVDKLLSVGHYGPFEHPQMNVEIIGFPHSTMQQHRTHRVGVSFDVTSGRYTGNRFVDVANGKRLVEDVFWFRPVGPYVDRKGRHYIYSLADRQTDAQRAIEACHLYAERVVDLGWSEEHARDAIPFNVRQDYVFSANARAMMHLFSVRGTADVQLECRFMAQLVFDQFAKWMPETGEWFDKKRARKNLLAP